MRPSFICSVLHLPTFAFLTAAIPPGWNEALSTPGWNEGPSKIGLPFDLNTSPPKEMPPESVSSSHEPMTSSTAMDKLIDPSRCNTPEELAANILVFPGLPGPNTFTSMQSASGHGRDHRGYPPWQQSSSCTFSSTSPGRRKTSDSSAGSTSRRYKKDRPSSRYEPYHVNNQHHSVMNSVSDVIPTSSKPGYVLPAENNPTRDGIGKLKEKASAVRTRLSTKKGTLFNVYDWNFLREYPEKEKSDDRMHQFLRHLNQWKGASDLDSFFYLQRDQEIDFLTGFFSKKHPLEFDWRLELNDGRRGRMLFDILLRLSDKKINLEDYPFFKNQIIDDMRQRLSENWEATLNPVSTQRIETLVIFIQDVTKVAQLLIVAQLSLFKEHEQELLTVEEVEKHLRFFQELWLKIDMGTPDIQKRDWAMRAHQLFRLQAQKKHFLDSATHKEKKYYFSWNIVNYWREKTGKSLRDYYVPKYIPHRMKELVGMLIFFSNYQA